MSESGTGFTKYQQGVIRRYYENIDTIALQRLGEIASDIYIDGGKNTKLWQQARNALEKIAPGDSRAANVISIRSVTGLAKLVGDLQEDAKRPPSVKSQAPSGDKDDVTSGHEGMRASGVVREQTDANVAAEKNEGKAVQNASGGGVIVTTEMLKSAMKAFRKRLKLTKLDDESRLGNRAMTGGRKSEIAAIMPPREYPKEVWDELVRQGKLRNAGGSFYELGEKL